MSYTDDLTHTIAKLTTGRLRAVCVGSTPRRGDRIVRLPRQRREKLRFTSDPRSTLSPSLSLGELGEYQRVTRGSKLRTTSPSVHHLKVATPVLLLVHAECLSVAIQGARSIGLSLERIVLLDAHKTRRPISYRSLNDLVTQGSQLPPFVGRSLAEDEAKTSIAFLAPSSGTTGVQKV